MNADPFAAIGPTVVAGAGSVSRLPGLIEADSEAIVLVCDAGIAAAGLVEPVATELARVAAVERFVAPAGEPTAATIDAAAALARRYARPTVVGLGGGTALDIAKLVAGLQRAGGGIADYALGAGTFAERAPAVMLPTTAGTGSEVTATAILGDAGGRKLWAWSPALLPDAVVLDPELTVSLPPAITIATGLDAFAHALEAASGQAATPAVERLARAAVERLTANLATVARDPGDLAARQRMQEGALLAGGAIDAGGTGIAHNIGHALGTCYHLPHGVAVALGLLATLEWSIDAAPARFAGIAAAVDGGIPVADLAARYAAWLDELGFAAVVAGMLPGGVDPARLAAAMAAPENAPMARNSARPPAAAELHGLAQRCAAVCARQTAHAGMPA